MRAMRAANQSKAARGRPPAIAQSDRSVGVTRCRRNLPHVNASPQARRTRALPRPPRLPDTTFNIKTPCLLDRHYINRGRSGWSNVEGEPRR